MMRFLMLVSFACMGKLIEAQTWEITKIDYNGESFYLYPKFKQKCCWESVIFWKKSDGVLKRGLPVDGKWIQFFVEDSSKVARIFEVQNGIFHGIWKEYFFNQRQESFGAYHYGKKDGTWRSWWENGEIKSESYYQDGEYKGQGTTWNQNGKIKRITETDADLTTGSVTEYHSSGVKALEYEYYRWGQIDSEWYPNGQLKFRKKYKNGHPKNGIQTYYFSNGQIAIQGKTRKGGEYGTWKYWHPNGKIKAIGKYAPYPVGRCGLKLTISWQGLKVGKWQYWDESGIKLAEGEYQNYINKKNNYYDEPLAPRRIGTWKINDESIENSQKIQIIDNQDFKNRFLYVDFEN